MTNAHPSPQPPTPVLDITGDPAELTAALIDIASVSGDEATLAHAVETALREHSHLTVYRDGDAVVARTELGRPERVVLAGHLDTVPLPSVEGARGTVPSSWADAVCPTQPEDAAPGEDTDPPQAGESGQAEVASASERILYGRGATDMKGGVAVQLVLAAALSEPNRDVTYVFYDHEEVDSAKSGLARLYRNAPHLLEADFAVLLEPTHGTVEGGCNGTLRFQIKPTGLAAHSGRAWRGDNAIHKLADVLQTLAAYRPESIEVEGLVYREGLNAIRINGGVAGNVIPDAATVEINYRFAPDKSLEQAQQHCRELFTGHDLEFVDLSPAARPGLDRPAAAAFVSAVGQQPNPKYGWTDVARFSEHGVPAVNFGPGDALLAHTDNEHVSASAIRECHRALQNWLTA